MNGLDDEALEEFNTLISGLLIPRLVKIADKYNYDRNSMIKYTADMLTVMCEVATFENFKTKTE